MNKKVLFVHDGPIYRDSHNKFYGIHLNDDLRKRYLLLGDEVKFLIRVERISDNDLNKYSQINSKSFDVIAFPNFKSIRLFFKNHKNAKEIIETSVRKHDIIVCRLPSASGNIALKESLKLGKPVLVEFVACTFDAYWNYNWKGKLIAHYKMFEQKRIMKKVPFSLYVTNSFLQNRYPTTGKTIECSNVELQNINEIDLRNRLRRIKSKKNTDPFYLGTVGALNVPYKSQSDVIRAIAKLKREGYNFYYYLVGQGNPLKLSLIHI